MSGFGVGFSDLLLGDLIVMRFGWCIVTLYFWFVVAIGFLMVGVMCVSSVCIRFLCGLTRCVCDFDVDFGLLILRVLG